MIVTSTVLIPFGARRKLGEILFDALQRSALTFHLAGSWFFKAAKGDSDVDLYVEYSPAAHEALKSLGFAVIGSNPDYPDCPEKRQAVAEEHTDNTVAIYQHATQDVQVQAFADLALALKMRDALARVFPDEHARTRGPNRHKMWAAAEIFAREITRLASPTA